MTHGDPGEGPGKSSEFFFTKIVDKVLCINIDTLSVGEGVNI